jgi:hypothetical protein
MKQKTFSCNDNGFSITFPNGLTLSTRFGYGNYCENQDMDKLMDSLKPTIRFDGIESDNAEIAVIRKNGEFAVGEHGDSVKGHVEIKEWLEVFKWCEEHKG